MRARGRDNQECPEGVGDEGDDEMIGREDEFQERRLCSLKSGRVPVCHKNECLILSEAYC